MNPFARGYPTYADWIAERTESKNVRWIRRKHFFFPSLTRRQLEEVPYSELTVTRKRWGDLNPEEKRGRVLAVQVLRRLRAGDEFQHALDEFGMTLDEAVFHLSPDYLWFDQTWCCKPSDSLEVEMRFYARDEGLISVVTKDRRDRSLNGTYMAAVNRALESGETTPLAGFVGKKILDAYGRAHYFETDPDRLYELAEMQEEQEFFEIYHDGN